MVQEAYVEGVGTRKVDDLVQAPGLTPTHRSERMSGTMCVFILTGDGST